jgi:electron transfer flavoprotein beta subunit
MKIAVLIKSIPDTAVVPQVSEDGLSVQMEETVFVMNPYDEHALEEAIRIKERIGAEVTVISMGGDNARKIIRSAFAIGADRGIFIPAPTAGLTGRLVAKVLAAAIARGAPDLVLAGRQAVDEDGAQVAERVAVLLGLAHASAVTRLSLGEGRAIIERELDDDNALLELSLPALFSVQKGINVPRYPILPNILKAKSKPIEELSMKQLGFQEEFSSEVVIQSLVLARQDRLRHILTGDLREQAKIIFSVLPASTEPQEVGA